MVDSANLVDYSFVPSAQTCCEQPPVPQPSTSGTATAKLINIGSGNPRNESYRMASSGLPQKLFGCLLLKKRFSFYTCIKQFDLVSHESCWFTLLGHLLRRPAAEHSWKSNPKKLMTPLLHVFQTVWFVTPRTLLIYWTLIGFWSGTNSFLDHQAAFMLVYFARFWNGLPSFTWTGLRPVLQDTILELPYFSINSIKGILYLGILDGGAKMRM